METLGIYASIRFDIENRNDGLNRKSDVYFLSFFMNAIKKA